MRPVPPPSMFDSLAAFVPAPEVRDWTTATFIDEDGTAHNSDHLHLRAATIGVLWTTVANSRKGRRIVGQCEMRTPQGVMGKWARACAELQMKEWFGCIPDFIITLDADYCRECGDAEFMALLEHELYHPAQEADLFGAPKFSKATGLPVFTIMGHDVEQFVGVVRCYGADAAGVRTMVDAANRPPEIARATIDHACGTCRLRVA